MNGRKLTKILLVVLVLLVGYVVGFSSSSFSSANNVIEYKIIGFDHLAGGETLEMELNMMGTQGWDLVEFGDYMAVFKRNGCCQQ
jgi:hypothetical protein